MHSVAIHNRTRPLQRPLRAGYASRFSDKLRGLAGRRHLAPEEGLILAEARASRLGTSIHMLGMYFDLCIVWLDEDLRVVDCQIARRWRSVLWPRKAARYVIECAPSRYAEFQLADQLAFEAI
ncbi:MAG: DUF192 domain-containing protein [Anaerolineales bacterium]|nr:DUF192 domain-containing protein [Anaerolineales bacterium]